MYIYIIIKRLAWKRSKRALISGRIDGFQRRRSVKLLSNNNENEKKKKKKPRADAQTGITRNVCRKLLSFSFFLYYFFFFYRRGLRNHRSLLFIYLLIIFFFCCNKVKANDIIIIFFHLHKWTTRCSCTNVRFASWKYTRALECLTTSRLSGVWHNADAKSVVSTVSSTRRTHSLLYYCQTLPNNIIVLFGINWVVVLLRFFSSVRAAYLSNDK